MKNNIIKNINLLLFLVLLSCCKNTPKVEGTLIEQGVKALDNLAGMPDAYDLTRLKAIIQESNTLLVDLAVFKLTGNPERTYYWKEYVDEQGNEKTLMHFKLLHIINKEKTLYLNIKFDEGGDFISVMTSNKDFYFNQLSYFDKFAKDVSEIKINFSEDTKRKLIHGLQKSWEGSFCVDYPGWTFLTTEEGIWRNPNGVLPPFEDWTVDKHYFQDYCFIKCYKILYKKGSLIGENEDLTMYGVTVYRNLPEVETIIK